MCPGDPGRRSGTRTVVGMTSPTLDVEHGLLARHGGTLVAIDEVGRGCVAGPVSCVAVAIDTTTGAAPGGVADSKLLTRRRREALVGPLKGWVAAYAIGEATVVEIDRLGIVGALGLAARRALSQLQAGGVEVSVVLLDGDRDFVGVDIPVVCRPKADRDCASVAAASVLAKVHRDAVMAELDVTVPGYGFANHAGYLTPEHLDALRRLGRSSVHRASFRIAALGE